jgi:hypothetical protein
MVEITLAPYLDDDIPLVQASLVTIDGELTEIDADHVIVEIEGFQPMGSQTRADSDRSSSPAVGGGCPCVRRSPSINEISHVDESAGSSSSSLSSAAASDSLPSLDSNEQARTFGAGAAGAAIGMMLGGPLFSVVLGIGAAFYSQQEGATGDVARAMGDVAIMARVRFLELDAKHHLLEKSQKAALKILKKLQHNVENNPEAKVKAKRFVGWCWRSIVEFENKNKLIQRVSIKAKEHLDSLAEQYSSTDSQSTPSGQAELVEPLETGRDST